MAALRSPSSQDSPYTRHTSRRRPGARSIIRAGCAKLSVSTRTKAHGTLSATFTALRRTAAECSSFSRRGTTPPHLVKRDHSEILRTARRASNCFEPGLSTGATATHGANGAPLALAGFDDRAWDRANREALA